MELFHEMGEKISEWTKLISVTIKLYLIKFNEFVLHKQGLFAPFRKQRSRTQKVYILVFLIRIGSSVVEVKFVLLAQFCCAKFDVFIEIYSQNN